VCGGRGGDGVEGAGGGEGGGGRLGHWRAGRGMGRVQGGAALSTSAGPEGRKTDK